ncbi:hypothetical protein J1614_004256 [Plenodomus biglobosus]|nr:hypothetical protein J1614_004256 [Plenodomus biglobosus]
MLTNSLEHRDDVVSVNGVDFRVNHDAIEDISFRNWLCSLLESQEFMEADGSEREVLVTIVFNHDCLEDNVKLHLAGEGEAVRHLEAGVRISITTEEGFLGRVASSPIVKAPSSPIKVADILVSGKSAALETLMGFEQGVACFSSLKGLLAVPKEPSSGLSYHCLAGNPVKSDTLSLIKVAHGNGGSSMFVQLE